MFKGDCEKSSGVRPVMVTNSTKLSIEDSTSSIFIFQPFSTLNYFISMKKKIYIYMYIMAILLSEIPFSDRVLNRLDDIFTLSQLRIILSTLCVLNCTIARNLPSRK